MCLYLQAFRLYFSQFVSQLKHQFNYLLVHLFIPEYNPNQPTMHLLTPITLLLVTTIAPALAAVGAGQDSNRICNADEVRIYPVFRSDLLQLGIPLVENPDY